MSAILPSKKSQKKRGKNRRKKNRNIQLAFSSNNKNNEILFF